jgi:hypothetical protein
MSELVRDIGDYLIEKSIIKGFGEDLFLNYEPEDPDDIVVLTEYKSIPAGFVPVAVRHMQIKVRGIDRQAALMKIWEIHNSFVKQGNEFIIYLSDRYLIPSALQYPTPLMVDDKERHVFVFNLSLTTTKDF